jgi:hypothetical protein
MQVAMSVAESGTDECPEASAGAPEPVPLWPFEPE